MSDAPHRPITDATGDVPPEVFRAAMHAVADMVADYLEGVEQYPVLPRVAPGEVRNALPPAPPDAAEPVQALLADYKRLIEPNVTHWNHPGFLAYFSTSGSGPGILGETLAAALNVQAMLWRTGPAATELEELVCDWVRQMMGLPEGFAGHLNDSASSSTMLALAAARHRADPDVRTAGLAGGARGAMRVYASEHAHSSVEKACITLGLGLDAVRKVPCDAVYAMRPDALAALIAADRAAGDIPIAVVPTVGTTSSTAVDPVVAVVAIARREGLWVHVDTAYAGAAAICPELRSHFTGVGDADSVVVNPHKWLFTPMDCSVLLLRDPMALKAAFALVPDYLRTTEQGVTNLSEYGPQLGRRFRALKLWFVIRAFGVAGLQARIRAHCALAREFAGWVAAEPDWEVVAPVPFSTVCFRYTGLPAGPAREAGQERILAAVNADGAVFLSGTKLAGATVLRLAIGNIRTRREHVAHAWDALRAAARSFAR